MKVKVPKEVKVIIHPYQVKLSHSLFREDDLAGCANHIKGEITIDALLTPSERDVTLLHEVLEVIKRQYCCSLEHNDLERIAQGFGEFLFNKLGIEFDWSDIESV